MAAGRTERTELLAALTAVAVAATVVMFLCAGARTRVAPGWLVAIGVPWMAFSIVLRVRRDDLGREGAYVDLWSVSHFVGGALLALLGIPVAWVTVLAIGWELAEVASRVQEHWANRVLDVVLAVAGWAAAAALVG
jgi:hypothetical protein